MGRPRGKSLSLAGVAEIITSKGILISYGPSLLKLWPASGAHRRLLEMQNLRPHPSPTESDLNLPVASVHYSLRTTTMTILRILDFILTVMESH